MRYLTLFTLTAALAAGAQAQNQAGWFPFVIPWDDAAPTATDVSSLNPAPIDDSRRVSARDGHFFDTTGRRVRFLGTGLSFNANFPDKADADKIAARLHKFGFNIVRLHHMDWSAAPTGIFDANVPDKSVLDADQLDRLDYLISQFKKNGIYVDLNLHVNRRLEPTDGVPDTDKLPAQGKLLAYYEPHLLVIQRRYAEMLLTHTNPYTGLKYADDPVVAIVELNNEDSLVSAAWERTSNNLPEFYNAPVVNADWDNVLRNLPAVYKTPLREGWNAFLKQKYGTTEKMLAAWNQPLGEEMIPLQPDPEAMKWELEQQGDASALLTFSGSRNGRAPKFSIEHVKINKRGQEDWHIQLKWPDLTLEPGKPYSLQFWARCSSPTTIGVNAQLNKEPWRILGLSKTFGLAPDWQHFNLNFVAEQPEAADNRLSFVVGRGEGEVWLGDVSLRPGTRFELPGDQSLEEGNIDLLSGGPDPAGTDYVAYLMQVESKYVADMTKYLRQDLGAKSMISCSQANFGGLAGVAREAQTDFVDTHAYWEHPNFPNRPWDPNDWNIPNTSMVKDANGGVLVRLALHRVQGKPFTVTEYNHPAPNDFQAETVPMLAAYAATQDWDGIFLFDYLGDRSLYHEEKIKAYFDLDTNPAKMAFLPMAAWVFLKGEPLFPGKRLSLGMSSRALVDWTARFNSGSQMWDAQGHRGLANLWDAQGPKNDDKLSSIYQLILDDVQPKLNGLPIASGLRRTVRQEWSPTAGLFKYDSPRVQVLVGFPTAKVEMGPLAVAPVDAKPGFLALALHARDGETLRATKSALLTVAGKVENTGMQWNAERTSVGNNWGTGPTVAEGTAAEISLAAVAGKWTVYALDGSGNRTGTVPSEYKDGRLIFKTGPEFKTLWYEMARE